MAFLVWEKNGWESIQKKEKGPEDMTETSTAKELACLKEQLEANVF